MGPLRIAGYAFGALGLNRIELRCATTNIPSQAVAKKLGFVLEGTLRQAEVIDDRVRDLYLHALLHEEWDP